MATRLPTESQRLPASTIAGDGSTDRGLRITLLGGFRVAIDRRPVADAAWRRRKAANLIQLLALAPEHRLHREQVTEALWGDRADAAATNNLHRTLHLTRRLLQPGLTAGRAPTYLLLDGETLALATAAPVWVDVDAFVAAVAAARRAADPAAYEAALAAYGGDLLPEERYADWAAGHRAELREIALGARLDLARLAEARGATTTAIQALQEVLATEPAHEDAHQALMRLHAAAGHPHQALRQYHLLRTALGAELDAEPSPASERLHREIVTGRFPAPRQASTAPEPIAPTNLPLPATSFVGRRRELADVRRLLAETRLLTLTGAGGCGKTRLAIEAASGLVAGFADGVWLVELAAFSDPAEVEPGIAAVLGLREEVGRPLAVTIRAHLRSRRMLLVLDNGEHLAAACAAVATALLAGCPELRLLVTSRVPLATPGELVWRVPSLEVPDPTAAGDPERLAEIPAGRLFLDRAAAALPGFALDAGRAAAVARICHRLDGMPLAIELAAAWVRVLAVEQIAARLDDALALLTQGDRTALPRQRTLRASIAWSEALLAADERRLFARLAVFVGGWTLEAAEAVAAGDGLAPTEVLPLLGELVRQSLVVATLEPGAARYHLLATVRQYAAERLRESGEADPVGDRHLAWCLDLAATAAELDGPRGGEWLDRLDRELPNLRAALAGAIERERPAGLRLAAALWQFWEIRGHLSEGRAWLERCLAIPGADAADRTHALNGLGNLVSDLGDTVRAGLLYDESLALARARDDRAAGLSSVNNLGNLAVLAGDHVGAADRYREALAIARALDDRPRVAAALDNLGIAAQLRGDYADAIACHGEALALHRAAGDLRGLAGSLHNLGGASWAHGDRDHARPVLEQALALGRELDDRWGTAAALTSLANVRRDDGEGERAAALNREALALWSEQEVPAGVVDALEGLGTTLALAGSVRRAVRFLAAADALRRGIGAARLPAEQAAYNRALARVRERLPEPAFGAAWLAAQATPLDRVVAEALADDGDAMPSLPRASPAEVSGG